MKKLRKILKLMPPAFIMRLWLKRHYGINVPPAPGNVIIKFALGVLPYAFTAALSVRVKSDRRLLKYLLPYGKMKNFLTCKYYMQVGDTKKDNGLTGIFRSILPYGLVLWWDAEDKRIVKNLTMNKVKPQCQPVEAFVLKFGWQMPDRDRLQFNRTDKIEAMTLRLLIVQGGYNA